MEVIHTDEKSFEKVVEKGLHLVDFYSPGCGPCRMLGPILDETQKDTDVQIVKVNVDENQGLAIQYGVMVVPTLIVFKDGEPVYADKGFKTKEQLLNMIEENK